MYGEMRAICAAVFALWKLHFHNTKMFRENAHSRVRNGAAIAAALGARMCQGTFFVKVMHLKEYGGGMFCRYTCACGRAYGLKRRNANRAVIFLPCIRPKKEKCK